MEVATELLWALGLLLLCGLAWATNLIAMPGNWIAVALLAAYAWLGPQAGRVAISWWVLASVFVLALLGETFEFAAGAVGAQRAGASRRATVMAVIGSVAGALLGAVVGIPVPVVGPVLAAVLFGALGATAGAMLGEWQGGKGWRESWPVGHAAFWGRLVGTLGKVLAGLAILVIIAGALLL